MQTCNRNRVFSDFAHASASLIQLAHLLATAQFVSRAFYESKEPRPHALFSSRTCSRVYGVTMLYALNYPRAYGHQNSDDKLHRVSVGRPRHCSYYGSELPSASATVHPLRQRSPFDLRPLQSTSSSATGNISPPWSIHSVPLPESPPPSSKGVSQLSSAQPASLTRSYWPSRAQPKSLLSIDTKRPAFDEAKGASAPQAYSTSLSPRCSPRQQQPPPPPTPREVSHFSDWEDASALGQSHTTIDTFFDAGRPPSTASTSYANNPPFHWSRASSFA